ncbi:MAG: glycosyltransferase family 4 protein [Sedimenticola sp.]
MTISRKFIAWQPVLTDHQAYTFRALGQEAGVPVVAYVTALEDATRKSQGWTDTQVSSVERHLIPKRGFLRYCYRQLRTQRTDVHLFGSPFQQPRLILCMLLAAWLGIEFYLISEPYSPRADGYLRDTVKLFGKIKATLRPWLYRAYALLFRRHVSGIFTISQLALAQYRQAGMPSSKLFPFGYFVPCAAAPPALPSSPDLAAGWGLRIIFVGNLIQRKGVDLLQEAVRQLYEQGCSLSVDIYGPGDASSLMRIGPELRYCGTIPFGQAQAVIEQYEVLVVPSRYDGWGVVVNEALCAGVPVVCSDYTGAGIVAEAFGAGMSFTSGDSRALSEVLSRLAHTPSLLMAMRAATSRAALALQPDVAARYMYDVIRAPADRKASLRSPWYPDCQ